MLEKNLDTVKSRCHYMYFLPPSKDNLATNLQTYYDVESSDAHFLSLFVEGCLGKALKLKDQGILKTKDEIIDQFILSSSGDAFLKEIFNDKEKIKEFLEVIFSWVRDAVLVKVGVEDGRLIHRDRLNELKSFQQGFTFEELERLKEEIVHTFKLLAENLNVKMPLLIIKERLQYG